MGYAAAVYNERYHYFVRLLGKAYVYVAQKPFVQSLVINAYAEFLYPFAANFCRVVEKRWVDKAIFTGYNAVRMVCVKSYYAVFPDGILRLVAIPVFRYGGNGGSWLYILAAYSFYTLVHLSFFKVKLGRVIYVSENTAAAFVKRGTVNLYSVPRRHVNAFALSIGIGLFNL